MDNFTLTDLTITLNALRVIVKSGTEFREVAISEEGLSLYLDTYEGVLESRAVCLMVDKDEHRHIRCRAKTNEAFVGEWLIQGQKEDHAAAWMACMLNRPDLAYYWLELLEE